MTDLIPRDAAIAAVYHADSFELSLCGTSRIEERIELIPTLDPAAIREAALKEAAAKCEYTIRNIQILKPDGETYETPRVQKIAQGLVEVARQEILALIGEKK